MREIDQARGLELIRINCGDADLFAVVVVVVEKNILESESAAIVMVL